MMKKTWVASKSLQEQNGDFNGLGHATGLLVVIVCATLVLTGCGDDKAVYKPAVSRLIERAQELKQSNQAEAAVCRMEAAADIAPDTFQVQYNLGLLYYNTQQLEKAVTHLKKALELSPEDPNALYTLGFAYGAMGDTLFNQLQQSDTAVQKRQEVAQNGLKAYQNALETYRQFIKVAPPSDAGRKDVEAEIELLQSRIQQLEATLPY